MTPSIVCLGELLIDFVALERDTSVGYAHSFEKAPGGAPANVAVGLAKLGLDSAFITQVGNDPFGHYLVDVLASHHVDISGIVYSQTARTTLAFVAVESDGERSFAFYRHPSADMLMTPEQLAPQLLEKATLFHYGSISLIADPMRSTTLTALETARKHGAIISYDPNLRSLLWPSVEAARDGLRDGLTRANLVKMNEEELAFLHHTGSLDNTAALVTAARDIWHDNLQLMVVTRGPHGCLAITPEQFWESPGFSVQVEDTIGSGDGFMAGLLAGVVQHVETGQGFPRIFRDDLMLPILRQANAVGALTSTKRGGIPALPTRTEVDAFLAKN